MSLHIFTLLLCQAVTGQGWGGGVDVYDLSVTGTITLSTGAPAAGAVVETRMESLLISQVAPRTRATADAEGRFLLTVPEIQTRFGCDLVLVATSADGREVATFMKRFMGTARIEAVDIRLQSGREIALAITDAKNEPIADAEAVATAGGLPYFSAFSDAGGKATVRFPAQERIEFVAARKPGVGLDYFGFRQQDCADRPGMLDPDHLEQPLKLRLSGAAVARAKVVDDQRRPVAQARITPKEFYLAGKGTDLKWPFAPVLTDAEGRAVLEFPSGANPNGILSSFDVSIRKFRYLYDYNRVDPKQDEEETLRITSFQTVRGKVLDAEKQPVANAWVELGNLGAQHTVQTNAKGEFACPVAPYPYCIVAWRDKQFSPPAVSIVRQGKEPDPVELILAPGTRVTGQLARDKTPLAQRNMIVVMNFQSLYDSLPKTQKWEGFQSSWESLGLTRRIRSDDEGKFEFFTGPGTYQIQLLDSGGQSMQVQVANEKSLQFDFLVGPVRKDASRVSGTVVVPEGVSKTHLQATIRTKWSGLSFSGPSVAAADGRFSISPTDYPAAVLAISPDGSYAGLSVARKPEDKVEVPLAPMAVVRGRLVDKTGAPHADQEVRCELQIKEEGKLLELGSLTQCQLTNHAGEFRFVSLPQGRQTHLVVFAGDKPRVLKRINLNRGGEFVTGDVKVTFSREEK